MYLWEGVMGFPEHDPASAVSIWKSSWDETCDESIRDERTYCPSQTHSNVPCPSPLVALPIWALVPMSPTVRRLVPHHGKLLYMANKTYLLFHKKCHSGNCKTYGLVCGMHIRMSSLLVDDVKESVCSVTAILGPLLLVP